MDTSGSSDTSVRDIHPSQMSYTFGKPLTEEEFRKLKASNPSVRTISAPIQIPTREDLQDRLRKKILDSQSQRSPAPVKKS